MSADQYQRVNGAWPEGPLPELTGPEAKRAARILFRKYAEEPLNRTIKIGTGRRRTWVRHGVFVCGIGRGWKTFIHDLSHYAHRRLGGKRPHDGGHAQIERFMIEHVVSNGWLEGKLKRDPPPARPKTDPKIRRAAKAKSDLERWLRRAKLAATKIKKLKRRVAYYQKIEAISA